MDIYWPRKKRTIECVFQNGGRKCIGIPFLYFSFVVHGQKSQQSNKTRLKGVLAIMKKIFIMIITRANILIVKV